MKFRVPAVQRTRESFDDRNGFLRAALGTVSLIGRFRKLLERYAPPVRGVRRAQRSGAPADDALLVVLGAIAVGDRLSRELSSMRRRAGTSKRYPKPARLRRARGGLLR